nr:hypothetical protein [uncultured Moraxella sp.]
MSGATRGIHPYIKRLQQQNQSKQSQITTQPTEAIDNDVWQLIKQHLHNAQEMAKMNNMIRA